MKKKFTLMISAILFMTGLAVAPAFGIQISFSYFFPFNGELTTPVAPLGFDDLGITFGEYFGISTGLSLYNVGGMAVKGVPFTNEFASTGPFLSLNIPLYLKIILPLNWLKIELKGGGFLFYNFGLELNKEFDKALMKTLNYATLISDFTIDSGIGIGWRVGSDITVYVTPSIGIVLGFNYLSGSSILNIRGSYIGGAAGGPVTNGTVNYPTAYLDYTGFTVSLGVEYKM